MKTSTLYTGGQLLPFSETHMHIHTESLFNSVWLTKNGWCLLQLHSKSCDIYSVEVSEPTGPMELTLDDLVFPSY